MNQYLMKVFFTCITILVITLSMNSLIFARQVEGTEIGDTGSRTVTDNYKSSYDASNYGKKLTEITNDIRKYSLSFIALAAVATAIIFMTAAVNPEAKTMGKIALTGIVIGAMFLVFSDGIGKIMFSLADTSPSKLQVNPGNKKKGEAKKIVEDRPKTESNILVVNDESGEECLITFFGEDGGYLYPQRSELQLASITGTGDNVKWTNYGSPIKIKKEDVPDDNKNEPVWVATVNGKNYYLANLAPKGWVPENADLDWGGEWLLRLDKSEVDKYIQVVNGKKYSGGIEVDSNGKVQVTGDYSGEIIVGEKAFYFGHKDAQNRFFQQGPDAYPLGPYPVELKTIKKDKKDFKVWYLEVKLPDGQIFPIKCYLIPDYYDPIFGEWMIPEHYLLPEFGYSIPK